MLDFHPKEIKSNVLSRFTEWIYISTEDLSSSALIYKIEIDSKLDKRVDDLSLMLTG